MKTKILINGELTEVEITREDNKPMDGGIIEANVTYVITHESNPDIKGCKVELVVVEDK